MKNNSFVKGNRVIWTRRMCKRSAREVLCGGMTTTTSLQVWSDAALSPSSFFFSLSLMIIIIIFMTTAIALIDTPNFLDWTW